MDLAQKKSKAFLEKRIKLKKLDFSSFPIYCGYINYRLALATFIHSFILSHPAYSLSIVV